MYSTIKEKKKDSSFGKIIKLFFTKIYFVGEVGYLAAMVEGR